MQKSEPVPGHDHYDSTKVPAGRVAKQTIQAKSEFKLGDDPKITKTGKEVKVVWVKEGKPDPNAKPFEGLTQVSK